MQMSINADRPLITRVLNDQSRTCNNNHMPHVKNVHALRLIRKYNNNKQLILQFFTFKDYFKRIWTESFIHSEYVKL